MIPKACTVKLSGDESHRLTWPHMLYRLPVPCYHVLPSPLHLQSCLARPWCLEARFYEARYTSSFLFLLVLWHLALPFVVRFRMLANPYDLTNLGLNYLVMVKILLVSISLGGWYLRQVPSWYVKFYSHQIFPVAAWYYLLHLTWSCFYVVEPRVVCIMEKNPLYELILATLFL